MKEKPDLDAAYSLGSVEDTRALYRAWANNYDQDFAAARGYSLPQKTAARFADLTSGEAPIFDVGAGTGLLAEALPQGAIIDGIDLSPEMLATAENKNIYRNLIAGDLNRPLSLPDAQYAAVLSSGTFTHGHVGPACLPELLRIAKPGALFVCSIRVEILDATGFGSALANLVAARQITPVNFVEVAIYESADHDHASDTGLIMDFRKL